MSLSVDEKNARVICKVPIRGAVDLESPDDPEPLLSKNFRGALASEVEVPPKSLRQDDPPLLLSTPNLDVVGYLDEKCL